MSVTAEHSGSSTAGIKKLFDRFVPLCLSAICRDTGNRRAGTLILRMNRAEGRGLFFYSFRRQTGLP
jgi:hypothetical protein